MVLKKSILTSLIAFGITTFSINGLAQDLYTTNDTNFDSTCRTNDWMCSTDILGEDGITRKHQRKVTTGTQLKLACFKNLRNCKADVYMQDKCGGPKIATIYFDTLGEGVKSIEMFDNSYIITGLHSFEVTISGGPAALTKK